MSSYIPLKTSVPNGLDEVGFKLSQFRLPGETLPEYRARLLSCIREPAGPTEQQYIRTIGRQLSLVGEDVFSIDLVLDPDGEPLAPDPYIEITSTVFRAYSDHENSVLDAEVILTNSDGRWARDIENAFATSLYFTIETLITGYEYYSSMGFMVGTSEKLSEGMFLRSSRENKLPNTYLVDLWGQGGLLAEEVATRALVTDTGQYYLDRTNGVLLTWDNGAGHVNYTYRQFPYRMRWSEVRAAPLNDPDWENSLYDSVLTLDGVLTKTALNSTGADYYNEVLARHGLQWGK